MGNDGGSIPTRRELVKEAARNPTTAEIKESQQEQQEYYWTTDPISQKPLAPPVVSDANGRLYNKVTILEYLIEGSRKDDAEKVTRGAVKSLKDVVEVKFETDGDGSPMSWKCPITGDRLGPGSKAVYLVPCGHAFSGVAIKEVSGEKCLACETEYASNDIIPILPTVETDIARLLMRVKTLQERGLTHSLKKVAGGSKKRKKREENDATNEQPAMNGHGTTTENGISAHDTSKANGNQTIDTVSEATINNTSTASLTAKVLEEGEAAKKRRRENDNVRSLFSSKDGSKNLSNNADFMTRGFSVPTTAKR